MATTSGHEISAEQYLALERVAPDRGEYAFGHRTLLPRGNPRHSLIVTNLAAELSQRLKSEPCRVFSTHLRLRIDTTGFYTYPDVMVVCGEMAFADDQKDTVLNPALIAEVLSESTKDYDRGGKFAHYRGIPSLREYLLIAQKEHHVEHFSRQDDGRWILWESNRDEDLISLPSLDIRIPISEIYDKVDVLPAE